MGTISNRIQPFPNTVSDEIEQVQQLIELLRELREIDEGQMYYTSKDVARELGVSVKEAQRYMNRPDFPKLEVGAGARVNKLAFLMYNLHRREKED